ncbi:MAG: hypothetical protein HQL82_01325 [Magnetococcales bacterium]|nr:hypothetical protein [Magnetococcales bacterium]
MTNETVLAQGLVALAGLAAGGILFRLLQRLIMGDPKRPFWSQLVGMSRKLLQDVTGDQFLQNYLQLVRMVAIYSFRNLVGMVLALLPLWLFLSLVIPRADIWILGSPGFLDIHPQGLSLLLVNDSPSPVPLHKQHHNDPVVLTGTSGTFLLKDSLEKYAFCPHLVHRLLFQSLGFATPDPKDLFPESTPGCVVVRPSDGRTNPLWPYLSNLELIFFVFLTLSSLGSLIKRTCKR